MRRFLFVSISAAILVLGRAHAADERPVILILGDSLSAAFGIPVEEGWVARLQRRLDAEGYDYRVVNASLSGETTASGLQRLPRALELHDPAVVIVELGGNDGLRGLPVAELEANLGAIVRLSRLAGSTAVLTGIRVPTNYGPRYTHDFFAAYGRVASADCVALVPFFLEGIATVEGLFQSDGIHPTVEAQPLLLDNVWPALEPLLAGDAPCLDAGPAPVSLER